MKTIFDIFCQKKSFFRITETYFSANASFPVVETDFLVSTNHKLFFRLVKTFFFLTDPSFQLLEKDFLIIGNCLFCLRVLFSTKTVTDISRNRFLKTDFILHVGTNFFFLVETIFFHCLRYFSRISSHPVRGNTFFSFGNHYLNYGQAYLKPLSLLLATIFFDFSDISAIVRSFFVYLKRILKQILNSC